MCSIILIHRLLKDAPVLLGANRDENKDRPADAPKLIRAGSRQILAPKDLQAGGTWLGINDAGLFVGITNRFGAPKDDLRRSRGEIPLLALAHENPQQAIASLLALSPKDYNAFHLLLTNREHASIVWSDGEQFHEEILKPGLHTLTESSFCAGPPDRESFIRHELENCVQNDALNIERLQQFLGEKKEPSFHGLCVDIPEINYATRSATVYSENANGKKSFLYTATPPNTPQWEDLSHLIPSAPF